MGNIKTYSFFNNIGGMNTRYNEVSLRDAEAEDILNLHTTQTGSWSSRNTGFVRRHDTALDSGAAIRSLYHYQPEQGQARIVVGAGDKLWVFEPGLSGFTQIHAGLTSNQRMNFVTMNGRLIGCNGVDTPIRWDGTGNVETLDGWPPEVPGVTPGYPGISALFNNRLVFAGDTQNPSLLYLSELETPENFTPDTGATSAGAIQVSPGDGERITGLKSLFLPIENEEVLIIFKENTTYMLTGHDADTFNLQRLSQEFGAVNHHSIVVVGNELMFLSREGVTTLSTATLQGNLTTGFISDKIRRRFDRLNPESLNESFAIHLRNRQEVWWFVPDGSAMENNRVLVYNYANAAQVGPVWSVRSGITAACGALVEGVLYTGSYSGFVHQQLIGNSYDGEAIEWRYRTPFYDFSSPRIRKRIRDIQFYLRQIAPSSITLRSTWDVRRAVSAQESETLAVVPEGEYSLFGASVYGSQTYNDVGVAMVQSMPPGSGRTFQMELSGNAVNQPVEIEGWTISAMYGGFQ
ncbi:MAG: hypothetical protein AB7P76_05195 [Candidatus Melainabacteria bacterium]